MQLTRAYRFLSLLSIIWFSLPSVAYSDEAKFSHIDRNNDVLESLHLGSRDSILVPTNFESEWAPKINDSKIPFLIILLVVFIGGLFTNLTPCVYPMIPITIHLLGKSGISPLRNSIAYAGGILVTYTILGISAALSGSLFGNIMASPTFNLIFAALMSYFAFSMLGFGQFSRLQKFGAYLGAGPSSLKNSFLMGGGAGLVASPCTGPILAALLAYTAESQDLKKGAFLLFVYSFGFAIPYVFLGNFSANVARMKISPTLQIFVKMAFSSIMFSLAFYYLKIPAYVLFASLQGYWEVLTNVSFILGVLLTGLWLASSGRHSRLSALIPSIVFGFSFFGFFEASGEKARLRAEDTFSVVWSTDEEKVFASAQNKNKPILVEGWAEWCAACKKMDAYTYTDPELRKMLTKKWLLLKFDLTESNAKNDEIAKKYSIRSLPMILLIPPNGDISRATRIGGYIEAPILVDKLKRFQANLSPESK